METLIDHKKFTQRLQKIMDEHQLSAASFAEKLDIGRATISHILSGRNKPSLDFVMKVVSVFSSVDLKWLIYGTSTSQNVLSSTQKSLPISTEDELKKSPQKAVEIAPLKPTQKSTEFLTKKSTTSSAIKRIIIFKEDGTFESYEMSLESP